MVFSIGVTYQTPAAEVEKLPGMLRAIVEAQELVRFDRAHFKSYGDFALVFEVVYWMLKPDYNLFMDTQQRINFAIYRQLQDEGIEFAHPTQTILLECPLRRRSRRRREQSIRRQWDAAVLLDPTLAGGRA